jgi:4-hydroxy-tetrahydrodipicolinate synthase
MSACGASTIRGVHAAVATPRLPDGKLDERAFRNWIEFLVEHDIRGFAVNGATGEYCLTTAEELERMLVLFFATVPADVNLICGIGAASTDRAIRLADIAGSRGATTVLLPPPHFFRYGQEDLKAFCKQVAGAVKQRVVLYHLPQFTTGFTAQTVLELVQGCPKIIGIKDSSGSLDILRTLRVQAPQVCRIVGSDNVLAQALEESLCDAVISGVAAVIPELIRDLWGQASNGNGFAAKAEGLAEFIQKLNGLPVPWGIKWIAQARGVAPASFPMDPSSERERVGRELSQWFRAWWADVRPQVPTQQYPCPDMTPAGAVPGADRARE